MSTGLRRGVKRWWPDIATWPARLASSPLVPIPLRMRILASRGHRIAPLARIRAGTLVTGRSLSLGRDAFVNGGCLIDAHGPVEIGDGARLGHRVQVLTEDHEPGDAAQRAGEMVTRPVRIGVGAWIGAGAILLPGTEVGDGCVVAAGAVASGTLEPHTLHGGVPAKPIRSLQS